MKKIFTLSAMMFLSILAGFSQTKTGVSAGFSHSKWSGNALGNVGDLLQFTDGMVSTESVNGIYAGGFVEIPAGDIISIQPSIFYSQKGYGLRGRLTGKGLDFLAATATARVQSHYIDIPVFIKAEIAKGLQIYAGPQVSYLVNSRLKTDAGIAGFSILKTNSDITSVFNKVDMAVAGGLSYTFGNGLSVNAGYDHGLTRLDKNERTQAFNRSFKLGIGFRF